MKKKFKRILIATLATMTVAATAIPALACSTAPYCNNNACRVGVAGPSDGSHGGCSSSTHTTYLVGYTYFPNYNGTTLKLPVYKSYCRIHG